MDTVSSLTANSTTMTSLQIADVTGKNHKEVLRAIRSMEPAWEKVHGRKFALTFRITKLPNEAERKDPIYQLTKTECLYIATKFNDEARARLVLRWEQLEIQNAKLYAISELEAIKQAKAKELLATSDVDNLKNIEEINAYEAAEILVTGMAPKEALERIGTLNQCLGIMNNICDNQEDLIKGLEEDLERRSQTIRQLNKVIKKLRQLATDRNEEICRLTRKYLQAH